MKQLPDQPVHAPTPGRQRFLPFLGLLQRVCLLIFVAVVVSGCVDSEVGVRFKSPHAGEITQQIQLGERLTSLSGDSGQQWIKTVERQAANLGGKVKRTANGELTVKIPFNNSDDLEEKFNRFFDSLLEQGSSLEDELPAIDSHLTIAHSNFLLLERDQLQYEIDLRSLGVRSTEGEVLVSPAALIRLEFKLETPWGARNVGKPDGLRPRSRNGSRELIWTLVPGEQNAFEAVFWMPSPLGIGAVTIALLVALGKFLRDSRSFNPTQARSSLP